MWHKLSYVAESRKLPVKELESFATKHQKEYHIVNEYEYPEVSTFNVDKLIKDFKTTMANNNSPCAND